MCFAVETTDLGMDPVWNIKWGSESEESWVSPGFGTWQGSSDALTT